MNETSTGDVKINWIDKYYSEGYCISRATSMNGEYSRIGTVEGKSYFIDKNVKKGKTYYYRVRGYMYYTKGSGTVNAKKVGYSKYSDVKKIRIKE